MKNFFLKLSLFLCGICVAQPLPPDYAYNGFGSVTYNKSKDKIELPNKFIRVDVNYGFETTLDFHLLKAKDKNLIGVGFSTYIGNDIKGNAIGQGTYNFLNTYEVRDNAYYLLLGRQIKRLSICAKVGIYTTADYNNYTNNIPNNIYYAKVSTEANFQYGGQVSWSANRTTGLSLGWDKFNGATIGITTLL
jgi:hypothetical protein